jgi:hypothetical protein
MRVVAARFPEPRQASAALELLERELDVADLAVAPLAHPGEPEGADAVLAGRVPDDQAPIVAELVERVGGEIVANVDESWTGLKSGPSSVMTIGGGRRAAEAYLR